MFKLNQQIINNLVSKIESKVNKVTNWSNTPNDDHYPSEKLVKDSLDGKVSSTDLTTGLQNIGGYTIHTVYNVSGTASAYDISSGLSYAQLTPVFFLVKNNIGDNQANATLKYYPNGDNITILDAFSSNSASSIQQGVWKKDTWGLFFCANNNWVQLKCVFYDSVDIDELFSNLSTVATSGSYNDLSNKPTIPTIPHKIYYGTCSTTASTQTKAVTCNDDFELETGCMLIVNTTTAQSYNASSTNPVKIKVNNGTSVNVQYINGNYSTRYMWSANEMLCFIYDGTNWVLLDNGLATTTYYGVTKLNNTVTSTSTSLSATANSVKTAYDKGVEAYNLADGKANSVHSHTISDITNFPNIPTSTYHLSNDGASGDSKYIEFSDVINNLTSTSSYSDVPLSAYQGKVLKDLVDGKASSTHTHNITDLNNTSTVSVVVTYTDETTETITLLKQA